MTYDIYRYIFIGGAIFCGIMFVVSVVLFIVLNIPKIISDLSGATARKAIKNIREQNEATGDKTHKGSSVNQARGRLTDKISPSGNIIQKYNSQQMNLGISTTKIETQKFTEEHDSTETAILSSYEGTTLLENEGAGETSVLSDSMYVAGETSVLNEVQEAAFVIEYDITYIHTYESIGTEVVT